MEHDAKSALLEFCQANRLVKPVYEHWREGGPDHEPVFLATVVCDGRRYQGLEARTVKEAEKSAARQALFALGEPTDDGERVVLVDANNFPHWDGPWTRGTTRIFFFQGAGGVIARPRTLSPECGLVFFPVEEGRDAQLAMAMVAGSLLQQGVRRFEVVAGDKLGRALCALIEAGVLEARGAKAWHRK